MKRTWFICVLICTSLISLLSDDIVAQATMTIVDNEASVEITTTVSKATTITVNSGILARQDSFVVIHHNGSYTVIDVEYANSIYTLYTSTEDNTTKVELLSSTRVVDMRNKAKALIKELK